MKIERIYKISDEELGVYFDNMKKDYREMFGYDIEGKRGQFVEKRRKLSDNENYFSFRIKNGETVGYVSFLIFEGKLWLYDILLFEKVRGTRVLIDLIKTLAKLPDFDKFDRIYFAVDKRNPKSFKTWNHLGAKMKSSEGSKAEYYLTKEDVKKYLDRINQSR